MHFNKTTINKYYIHFFKYQSCLVTPNYSNLSTINCITTGVTTASKVETMTNAPPTKRINTVYDRKWWMIG